MPRATFRLREDRYQEATVWLASRGFQSKRTPPEMLQRYQPWVFPPADYCFIRATGRLGEARLEIFEYEYRVTRGNGRLSSGDQTVAILSHPGIDGSARIASVRRRFEGLPLAVRALLWTPPLVLIRGAVWVWDGVVKREQEALPTGDALFDRAYRVWAASSEGAARAVSPSLREILLRSRFQGFLEIRPGLLLYALEGVRFEGEGLSPLLDLARGFLESIQRPRGHPLR